MSGNTTVTEAQRAQTYAKNVADAMLALRGYQSRAVPRDVVNDVFHEMARHDRLYTGCYARGANPLETAELIQRAIWGG